MTFKDTGRKFLRANRSGANKFLKAYEKEFVPLSKALSTYSGLKTDIDVGYNEESLDVVRFAALTNDVFTFALHPSKAMVMSVFGDPSNRKDIFGEKLEISIQTDRANHLLEPGKALEVLPSFVHPSHREAGKLVDTIAPLMLQGRALLRPHRTLIVPKSNPVGREKWEMLDIDPSSPFDHWSNRRQSSDNLTVPLRQEHPGTTRNEIALIDVMLPFLSGIGFYDLARILEDEDLHLAKARVAMKKVMKEANSAELTKEQIINDVLRPELDNLERRFRALGRSKILKQGAAVVGAATLSLVALSTGGVAAALGAATGAGGLGLIAKDWLSDKEKAEAYADSPHYLFWRLRRLQR